MYFKNIIDISQMDWNNLTKYREILMGKHHGIGKNLSFTLIVASVLITQPALAASGDVSSIENFIRSVIELVAGLAGLVASGFFVLGGFGYITSSGHPERLDNSKRTITWSAVGLAITIGAFVLSNIVTGLATHAFGS